MTLKVLLLEGGKKYILRGKTSVPVSGTERTGGTYRMDPSLRRGPRVFLHHVMQTWRKVVSEF